MILVDGEYVSVWEQFRSIFVSPDIAPYFWLIKDMSRDEFRERVNCPSAKPVAPNHLQTFLKVCYHYLDRKGFIDATGEKESKWRI